MVNIVSGGGVDGSRVGLEAALAEEELPHAVHDIERAADQKNFFLLALVCCRRQVLCYIIKSLLNIAASYQR